MHVSKDSMWREIWEILQNFLETKQGPSKWEQKERTEEIGEVWKICCIIDPELQACRQRCARARSGQAAPLTCEKEGVRQPAPNRVAGCQGVLRQVVSCRHAVHATLASGGRARRRHWDSPAQLLACFPFPCLLISPLITCVCVLALALSLATSHGNSRGPHTYVYAFVSSNNANQSAPSYHQSFIYGTSLV